MYYVTSLYILISLSEIHICRTKKDKYKNNNKDDEKKEEEGENKEEHNEVQNKKNDEGSDDEKYKEITDTQVCSIEYMRCI